jgi:hypothetical protein
VQESSLSLLQGVILASWKGCGKPENFPIKMLNLQGKNRTHDLLVKINKSANNSTMTFSTMMKDLICSADTEPLLLYM